MQQHKKTFGLIAIAIYSIISGVMLLPTGLILLCSGQTAGVYGLYFTAFGIVSFALGVLFITAACGILTLQEWGRKSTVWLSVISIPLSFAAIFPIFPKQEITIGNTMLQVFGIVLCIVIIRYLTKENIKVIFSSPSSHS